MRVYISVDMEGIGGINHPAPDRSQGRRYPAVGRLMVGETNAAIEGALAAGATDILVNDSHWNMYNLLPEDLHPAARVLQGQKAWSMVAGAQPGPDGAPPSTSPCSSATTPGPATRRGTIAHTYSGAPVETRLDGRPTGEYGLNALVARRVGHPGRAGRRRRRAWPRRSRPGCRGPSGSSSRPRTVATARSRSTRRVARDRVRAGAGASRPTAPRPATCSASRVGPPVVDRGRRTPRGVVADHAAIVPGCGADRRPDRALRRPTTP